MEAYLTSTLMDDELAEADGGLLPHEAQALAALTAAAQRAAPPVLSGTQLLAQLRATRVLSTVRP